MIIIKLDTPISDDGRKVGEFAIETPILALHILRVSRESKGCPYVFGEIFFESVLGLSRGALGRLTLEDYAKVSAAINPFLASLSRPDLRQPG